MENEKPIEITTYALAEPWREIALYLQIWDLLPSGPLLASKMDACDPAET